jgi:TRAP-type C4-dicarboxylate transport system permease large subunit
MAGIPQAIARWVDSLSLGPNQLLLALAIFYILLGLFLDGISILVLTLPVVMPIVHAAGIDPVWFGIFLVLMIEMGLMTPPVGFNLFVIQSISGEPVIDIARAAFPFFVLMALAVTLFTVMPNLVLWLPRFLYG